MTVYVDTMRARPRQTNCQHEPSQAPPRHGRHGDSTEGRCGVSYREVERQIAGIRGRRRGVQFGLLVVLLLLSGMVLGGLLCSASAQEPPAPTWPPPVEEPAEEPEAVEPTPEPELAAIGPYLSAAGWCSLRSGDDAEDVPGCEAGIAAGLYSKRLNRGDYSVSAVAIIGESSVGAGVAWCRGKTCAGVGVVAVRDDAGINTSTLAPAVGATWRP